MSKYKLPKHIKIYIEHELYDYIGNKKLQQEIREDIIYSSGGGQDGQPKGTVTTDPTSLKAEKLLTSRALLIVTNKIQKIEKVLNSLSEDEREIVEIIFFKGHSQIYAEMHDNISKNMYYYMKNKVIYLTAKEYNQI